MDYPSRVQFDLDVSRRIALNQELQYSRAVDLQRSPYDYQQARELDNYRAEREFQEYQLRRDHEHRTAEAEMLRERLAREERQREYELHLETERRARAEREHEIDMQRRMAEEEGRKKAELLAASRRIELQKQLRVKQDIERENVLVLSEQREQEKLESELRAIDIQIGTIYDKRDERKQVQLLQLQKLDISDFKLRQQLRGSKARIVALEESLSELFKLAV